jgi:hypothetical protein
MSTELESYRNDLLMALRLKDVSGPRIAEVLAEVDSHVQETGESPVEAFGPPKDYAHEVVTALRPDDATGMFMWDWGRAAVTGLGSFAGAVLLIEGLITSIAGGPGPSGLPPVVAVVAGLILLVGIAFSLVRSTRRSGDRVIDPRSGEDMTPPLPRWAIGTLIAAPVLAVVLAVGISLLARA